MGTVSIQPETTRKWPWRRWNAALHRDLGYLAVGLTLVYAISGLAVNHVADWNPNFHQAKETRNLQPLSPQLSEEEMAERVLAQLNISEKPKSFVQSSEDTFELFFRSKTIRVDLPSGATVLETTRQRPVLYQFNRLHLNTPKKIWTYIADAYALTLIFLAISGLFIIKGKKGLLGRGAWLTGLGLLLPLVYWIWWAF